MGDDLEEVDYISVHRAVYDTLLADKGRSEDLNLVLATQIVELKAEIERHHKDFARVVTPEYEFVRLSIPGNACVHCGSILGQSVVCPGCNWVDPITKSPDA